MFPKLVFAFMRTIPVNDHICKSLGRLFFCLRALKIAVLGYMRSHIHVPFYCTHDAVRLHWLDDTVYWGVNVRPFDMDMEVVSPIYM